MVSNIRSQGFCGCGEKGVYRFMGMFSHYHLCDDCMQGYERYLDITGNAPKPYMKETDEMAKIPKSYRLEEERVTELEALVVHYKEKLSEQAGVNVQVSAGMVLEILIKEKFNHVEGVARITAELKEEMANGDGQK